MVIRPRKFCARQVVYDRRKKTYACFEYLVDARVVQCPFSESDIYKRKYENKSRYYFEINSNTPRELKSCGDGVCREFEITSEVRRDLMQKRVI